MRRGGWKGQNVLFVTVDTLRADRLPAYGRTDVHTPTIDALAARGVLFERCETATPLTLPSHTTIFSGTLPLHHGVRDNGAFTVPPELPLLAELFHAGGYATAAFVSAFVLDSRWKLNRGFDTYFDQFDTRQANILSIGDIERPAGEAVDAVLDWVKRRDRARPFFLWVHFFDPHAPYAPPPPFSEEYKDRPYLGEIAYVDSELGRLLRALGDEGVADRTAVVFAGDHGESLGEHGEDGHGFFVYEATLHVPLVFAPPRERPRRAPRRDRFPRRRHADGRRSRGPSDSRGRSGPQPRAPPLRFRPPRGKARVLRDLVSAVPLRLERSRGAAGRPLQAHRVQRTGALRPRRGSRREGEPRDAREGEIPRAETPAHEPHGRREPERSERAPGGVGPRGRPQARVARISQRRIRRHGGGIRRPAGGAARKNRPVQQAQRRARGYGGGPGKGRGGAEGRAARGSRDGRRPCRARERLPEAAPLQGGHSGARGVGARPPGRPHARLRARDGAAHGWPRVRLRQAAREPTRQWHEGRPDRVPPRNERRGPRGPYRRGRLVREGDRRRAVLGGIPQRAVGGPPAGGAIWTAPSARRGRRSRSTRASRARTTASRRSRSGEAARRTPSTITAGRSRTTRSASAASRA